MSAIRFHKAYFLITVEGEGSVFVRFNHIVNKLTLADVQIDKFRLCIEQCTTTVFADSLKIRLATCFFLIIYLRHRHSTEPCIA